jgi:5-methyltetrahydrofolate--homocysteine methyltransferase
METVITSPARTVRIGPGRPFVMIGERINPTGRKLLAAEMAAGNFDRVRADALAQVAAGAHMLDVNAGIPLADEPAILAEAIRVVQSVVDVPLCIDSSIVAALEAGLAAYQGKPLVNSVTGEEERLESVLPLVAQHGAAVIGISNDETGISEDPDERFAIARKIVERAESYGIPREDVLIDPLAMPIGAVRYAGATLFTIVRRLRDELGVNACCGASNISFGLPDRATINAAFLAMAIASGMTCAITNPIEPEIKKIVLAADLLMGNDENCSSWLSAHRAAGAGATAGTPADEAAAARAARRERRRAREGAAE